MLRIIPFSTMDQIFKGSHHSIPRVLVMLALVSASLLGFNRTTLASDQIPDQASINGIRGFPQKFILSCESRSAVDWAAFWGVEIREKRFLLSLPNSDNPERGFVGNPNDTWGNIPPKGYGVHADPVAETLRTFGLKAEAHHGLSWEDLKVEIAAGRPVIVWVVGHMWPGNSQIYQASDGQKVTVARYEHTMILIGYDPRHARVIDAYSGQIQIYPLKAFLASWKTLGRMAITGSGLGAAIPDTALAEPVSDQIYPELEYFPLIFGPNTYLENNPLETAPPIDRYTVKRGEYLVLLAKRFGIDWLTLATMNDIPYPYTLYPGQVLRLR